MGKVANHSEARGTTSRRHPQGQALRRFAITLVSAVALIAAGLSHQESPSQAVTFQQSRAWADLTKQLSFGPRTPGSTGHLRTRDYILDELGKTCESVRKQEFEHTWARNKQKVRMWNVIGEQNWKDAKVRVLLMAHWDTRPTADQEWDSARARRPILGANDGASGVAVLLELARVMKANKPSDVGIMYLFTDGEDLGPGLDEMFLGASHFAKNLPTPKPDYGILIDMIGDRDLQVPMEPNSMRFAPELMKELYDHAEKIGLGKTFPKTEGPEISDDHLPLNEAGIPTIDLIDFDYPAWHTLGDTIDKVSADSLGKVGKLLETWLAKKPPFSLK